MSDNLISHKDYGDVDEVIVGIHHSGIELQEGLNISLSRNYCANCRRKIHCYVKVNRETKEAVVHNTCKNTDCKCKCRTHFACRQCGYLHPYGHTCNYVESEKTIDPQAEAAFQEIMDDWRENQTSK